MFELYYMEANVKPSYRFSPVSLTEIHEAHQTSTRDIVFRGTSKPRTQSVPPWFHHIFCPWLSPTPFKKGMLRWEQNGFHRFRFVLVHSYKQVLCKSHKFSNPNIGKNITQCLFCRQCCCDATINNQWWPESPQQVFLSHLMLSTTLRSKGAK